MPSLKQPRRTMRRWAKDNVGLLLLGAGAASGAMGLLAGWVLRAVWQ